MKYLITFKKKNSLVEREFYRKGKRFFYIEKIWDNPEIVLDKKPNLKKYNPLEGLLLSDVKFKSGEFETKSKIVIPDNIPEAEAKKIKSEYRKYNSIYDVEGWESAESEIKAYGEIEMKETPYHLLTLFSSEIEMLLMKVTKEKFNEYLSEGFPQDDFEDLEQNTEFSGLIYDELTMLSIDENEMPNFHKLFKAKYNLAIKEYEKKYPKRLDVKNKKTNVEYAVVGERWIKRSWHTLEIYEEFDFTKLNIEISRDSYFGRDDYAQTFSLNYAGKEFEFKENYGADSDDFYLMTSLGDRSEFSFIESEEEDWEDEDN
jgi:hypothetical protein